MWWTRRTIALVVSLLTTSACTVHTSEEQETAEIRSASKGSSAHGRGHGGGPRRPPVASLIALDFEDGYIPLGGPLRITGDASVTTLYDGRHALLLRGDLITSPSGSGLSFAMPPGRIDVSFSVPIRAFA